MIIVKKKIVQTFQKEKRVKPTGVYVAVLRTGLKVKLVLHAIYITLWNKRFVLNNKLSYSRYI